MIPTRATSLLVAWMTGCYIEQDVLVTDAQSDLASLEPSFRYAYYREDPVNNRIHLRFTDYWNPCLADAQLQNQLRSAASRQEQADAWAALMPRRAWSADVYLTVPAWPERSQTDLELDVVPQEEPGEGGDVVTNYGLVCLLRLCPYEEQCDRCLPPEPGAVAGLSRTLDHLSADYFETSVSPDRVQQYASSGQVRIGVWNPAVRASLLGDTGEAGIDPSGTISGQANLDLREFGQSSDAGTARIDFTAQVCEAMQATWTPDLADFQRRDLNTYGPPACRVGPAGVAAVYGLGVLALVRRRRRASSGSSPATAGSGAVAQPVAGPSPSSSSTAKTSGSSAPKSIRKRSPSST